MYATTTSSYDLFLYIIWLLIWLILEVRLDLQQGAKSTFHDQSKKYYTSLPQEHLLILHFDFVLARPHDKLMSCLCGSSLVYPTEQLYQSVWGQKFWQQFPTAHFVYNIKGILICYY